MPYNACLMKDRVNFVANSVYKTLYLFENLEKYCQIATKRKEKYGGTVQV